MIKLKRVYEEESPNDGARFLIERLWPRGMTKESLHVSAWLKRCWAEHGFAQVVQS